MAFYKVKKLLLMSYNKNTHLYRKNYCTLRVLSPNVNKSIGIKKDLCFFNVKYILHSRGEYEK